MTYVKIFLKYFEEFPVFTVNDVKLFLKKNGAGKEYYKLFIHNMVKGGKIFVIKRGCYTIHDDPMIAGFAFSPLYYGLETSLTYYKLWDYITPITIITTNRVRKSNIELLGRNASLRSISKDKFFGYASVDYKEGIYLPIADIEKTVIDSIYFHARFSKGIYAKIVGRIDHKKLDYYLKSYNKIIRKQVDDLLASFE